MGIETSPEIVSPGNKKGRDKYKLHILHIYVLSHNHGSMNFLFFPENSTKFTRCHLLDFSLVLSLLLFLLLIALTISEGPSLLVVF